jgi:hypothetical protein
MPRHPRLDAPGTLNHVMGREIEGRRRKGQSINSGKPAVKKKYFFFFGLPAFLFFGGLTP